ncbi:family 43 glycosylhydrolase [Alkalitalea saponilacus]|uniref:Por secretion system C-terminal sorting domain-containing protein n=1 Tax=Alkalitalea saponilacus TaxID=889453 RepID=A0A1T5AD81_9BACT|nr:family 43 glycosylhydrolase [Alkalitalea saponilacus]ASB48747.1 hypothetical protein CDL62_06150 [Alkalitalea saponilacus]SKB32876.1 Por secretion system C-terminal sorting domain-containing protein [Alkalitalea saponilacus]
MKKNFTVLLTLIFIANYTLSGNLLNDFTPPPYFDTYHEFATDPENWSIFNVHDPTVTKDGEWYYMFNTDVAFGGHNIGTGAMVRRSRDLVKWEFLGTAFNGVPQSAKEFFLPHNPNYDDSGIWAPFVIKVGDEFRLYYSAPGGLDGQNLAYIGFATSQSAAGPWEDQGHIVHSLPNDPINAIDPSVVIDPETGKHWMVYGSYQTGMFVLELDSETGGILNEGDKGVKIAARSGGRHGSIEGPEFSYRNGWFYLFVSYDWLEDFYNVRVGRSRNPEGPYYDINGRDMAAYTDDYPMILAPYRFNHHMGWQGTGHNAIFNDNGDYYIFHQARPSTSIFCMNLHVRKIHWVNDWPVVEPQRYANVPQTPISENELIGQWEHLLLIYNKSIPHQRPSIIELLENGTIDNNAANRWSLDGNKLTMSWGNGQHIDQLIVSRAWDWELRRLTITYTGMNEGGLNIWGKHITQDAVDAVSNVFTDSVYVIRNHNSNKVLEVFNGNDAFGTNIIQNTYTGANSQKWMVENAGSGYVALRPISSSQGRYLEVANNNANNGANIRLGTNVIDNSKRLKFNYQENGYFSIHTASSNDIRSFDVSNFSTQDGANVVQWEYMGGNNQLWRIERIPQSPTSLMKTPELRISIYPNPTTQKSVTIDLNSVNPESNLKISIYNISGSMVEQYEGEWLNQYQTKVRFENGIYFIRVETPSFTYTERVISR